MNRLRRILVGIDFSECSLNALSVGVRIARWNGAALHLLHAESPTTLLSSAEPRIKKLVAGIDGLEVHTRVTRGPALEVFLDVVDEVSPDLLLMGAYGPLGSYLGTGIGALTAQVLRHVPSKVLVVREREVPAFKTILACIDFSPTSEVVLEQAVRVAGQEQARLHLLHVVDEDADRTGPGQRLEELAARVAGEGPVGIETKVLERPGHAQGVLSHAKTIGADLVVLGTRGESDLQYVLMGRTSERVLREVRCCTLVVKPADFVSPREVYGR